MIMKCDRTDIFHVASDVLDTLQYSDGPNRHLSNGIRQEFYPQISECFLEGV